MEGYSRKGDGCPQLLDLLQKQSREWCVMKREDETSNDDKKLELSLGPPGGGGGGGGGVDIHHKKGGNNNNKNNPLHAFIGYFSEANNHKLCGSASSPWPSSISTYQEQKQLNHHHQTKESSSQLCCNNKVADFTQTAEKQKGLSPTAVPNTAQKRTAPAPVVGWPPIRSFRKNLASSSSSLKPACESQNKFEGKKANENIKKGQFVKINMDGIPIGRKVDLTAYDSYDKLSCAVDQLFRGLLAAQSDSSENKKEKEKMITSLLDGSGEYTLVYEDNEGDRMLVGDVPWHMFVTTVKRLRVLKSSELTMLCRRAKHGKLST